MGDEVVSQWGMCRTPTPGSRHGSTFWVPRSAVGWLAVRGRNVPDGCHAVAKLDSVRIAFLECAPTGRPRWAPVQCVDAHRVERCSLACSPCSASRPKSPTRFMNRRRGRAPKPAEMSRSARPAASASGSRRIRAPASSHSTCSRSLCRSRRQTGCTRRASTRDRPSALSRPHRGPRPTPPEPVLYDRRRSSWPGRDGSRVRAACSVSRCAPRRPRVASLSIHFGATP